MRLIWCAIFRYRTGLRPVHCLGGPASAGPTAGLCLGVRRTPGRTISGGAALSPAGPAPARTLPRKIPTLCMPIVQSALWTLTTLRHDKACKLLAQFARSAGCLANSTDKTDFNGRAKQRSKGTGRGGVIHTSSHSYLFDAHGVHVLAPSASQREPEAVIRSRERWKTNKYKEHAFMQGCEFVPFVLDTYGRLGHQAELFCEKLAAEELAFGSHSPEYIAIPLSTFRMELACLWQKYTSRAIIHFAKLCRAEIYKTLVH